MNALHQLCLTWFHPGEYQPLLQAIVCGKSIMDPSLKEPLIRAGLIHLFVVSGGHLVFLSEWVARVGRVFNRTIPAWLLIGILFLYGAVADFQPPILRGLIFFSLLHLSNHWRLNWPGDINQFLSGVLAFAFCTSDWEVMSLLMSWLASICLAIFMKRGLFIGAFAVYLVMVPALTRFQIPGIGSVLMNILIGPVFSLLLLPASVLSAAIPFIQSFGLPSVFDAMYRLLGLFEAINHPFSFSGVKVSTSLLWMQVLALHLVLRGMYSRERFLT